ncbi:WSC-domain-containing protein [Mytilinidion resinicola]|uniref:WSC-domain-containing protein n=1 Tax=Mytilinidion resinicola TaxID=574789 RepID=A0A6A6Z844_9PEZI|nr:WSC-domain-containing protein [Mytilinidion resinicola]KAF2816474.1 WSC-domain-containing protein [Mytilinidion resinicola]
MRTSTLLLPVLSALLANACDTELPCDGDYALNTTSVRKRFTGPVQSGPVHLTSYKTWTASTSSCWSDLTDGLRALDSAASGIDQDHLTVESCLDACEAAGYSLAGVEYSRECYCGNTLIGNNQPISDATCNMPCSGNANELCGGPGALNLYIKDNYPFTTGPAFALASYKGYAKTQCWEDPDISNRILPTTPSTPLNGNAMTVEKCIDACTADGYSSAGLEYARECYCGNVAYPIGQSTDISDCDMACLGDASENCGGRNRMIVYNKPDTPVTVTKHGIIQVSNSATGASLGYLSKNALNAAQYAYTPLEGNALTIQLDVPTTGTTAAGLRITALNGNTGFPLLGLVQGRDSTSASLAAGSYNYVYVAGVNGAPAGSVPQSGANSYSAVTGLARSSESDVWTLTLATGALVPQWVNPDGSSPDFALFGQSTAVYGGGDEAQFLAKYPAPVTPLSLTFVETT